MRTLRISPDFDYYIQDENGLCSGSTDDVIENTDSSMPPAFRFIVPGISEWIRRYENATDFSKCETDPDFNWRLWHREGLLFAKEIHRQLPRNYNLIYECPYEDKSKTLSSVDFSSDNVNEVIRYLGDDPYNPQDKPSYYYRTAFDLKNEDPDGLSITFTVGNLHYTLHTRRTVNLNYLRIWMERIAADKEDIIQVCCFVGEGYAMQMIPQRVGQFREMGQFVILDRNGKDLFSAYVNRREFVKGLYLTLLNHYGYRIYGGGVYREEGYPQVKLLDSYWKPYNSLRSDIIEWYITDELYHNTYMPLTPGTREIRETVFMWVDCGCCFWDTMGVGSGDEDGLSIEAGEFDMDIPGLKEWIYRWEVPDTQAKDFNEWWEQGWQLAQEVRRRLPLEVDLYYMGYDTNEPDSHVDYGRNHPGIIVPRALKQL